MDYVVLARKLRPARFQELIGQETVARALSNAVVSGRTAHAYLFAGSRGVGKTSTARILTKALNCLDLKEGEPCNVCGNCEEITHNASPDVLEIDAASNRGIDSIRELRENTKYAPAKCTYKTYIIDEVHMLTMESFNALLKTLEEPPPHVKFILATTAPHRIPETILSRCQRYDFPRIPVGKMQEYLARVTADEGITLSPTALETIARNASGSMRDALTAVDQVVAFAGPAPSDERVLSILEVMDTREVLGLLGALLDKSLEQALEIFTGIVERGHDLTTLLEALLREVKDYSLYKSLHGKSTYFQDHPPTTLEFYGGRDEAVTLDELQQIFYLLLELEAQLKLSEHRWACFEMALVKACRVEPLVGVPELLAQVRSMMGDGPPSATAPRDTTPQDSAPNATVPRNTAPQDSAPIAPALNDAAPIAPADDPRNNPRNNPQDGPPSEPSASQPAPSASAAEPPPPAPANSSEPPGPPPEAKPAPDSPAETQPEAPPLDQPLPCEDARWLALVEAVRKTQRKLAADLRRVEVAAIGDAEVEIVLPGAGMEMGPAELDNLRAPLAEAFGAAFQLRIDRDSNRKARHGYSLIGREEQIEQARLAAEHDAAGNDEKVRRVMRAFPQGKVEDVAHPETPRNRRNDV